VGVGRGEKIGGKIPSLGGRSSPGVTEKKKFKVTARCAQKSKSPRENFLGDRKKVLNGKKRMAKGFLSSHLEHGGGGGGGESWGHQGIRLLKARTKKRYQSGAQATAQRPMMERGKKPPLKTSLFIRGVDIHISKGHGTNGLGTEEKKEGLPVRWSTV